ncbi:MAG: YheT family hydrolase [bacterium]
MELMNLNHKLIEFEPNPWIKGGDLQTIVGYYLSGTNDLDRAKLHTVQLSDGDSVVVCENRPAGHPTNARIVLLMHGLGGEAASPYMLRLASLFRARGWIPFRMNHRGCGEGRGQAKYLYHSGRSEDVSQVLHHIEKLYPAAPIVAVGFSLSGNVLLKLLGEQKHSITENLSGAMAVCPPIDLALCSDSLCRRRNWIYDFRFVQMLRAAIQEHRKDFSDFPAFDLPWHLTLRQFDERCTAPFSGFESAEDYYAKCSANQFLENISLPTYLLAGDDDPFIPKRTFDAVPTNDFIEMHITRSGGHMGFVAAEKTPLGNRRWMDYAVVTVAESFIKEAKAYAP